MPVRRKSRRRHARTEDIPYRSLVPDGHPPASAAALPLMVSATETAEELSAAAVTRGIEDPAPKTSAVFLRLSPVDLAGMAAGLVLLALSFVVQ